MSRERWGTFSVADHLRPRAFVADVLLYDRLVLPYPPTTDERDNWVAQDWDPGRLDHQLDVLGEELVVRVPWNQWAKDRFDARMQVARAASFDAKNLLLERDSGPDAFHMTRMILAQDYRPKLPKGVAKVWAIAAYPSVSAYDEDQISTTNVQREKLSMVLTYQFLVPEDRGKSDDEMLLEVVELSKRDDFREKRKNFHRWQESIIEEEIAPEKAVEELEEYLRQYNEIVMKATKETWWKFGFLVPQDAPLTCWVPGWGIRWRLVECW